MVFWQKKKGCGLAGAYHPESTSWCICIHEAPMSP